MMVVPLLVDLVLTRKELINEVQVLENANKRKKEDVY